MLGWRSTMRIAAIAAIFGFATTLVGITLWNETSSSNFGRPIRDARLQWAEIKWPFAADLWGAGKAFECGAIHCSQSVRLYVRAKLGFCNCKTGVADDEELERVSDLAMLAGRSIAAAPGRVIAVSSMKGRSRTYSLVPAADTAPTGKAAFSIAFNDRCDVIVATAVLESDANEKTEKAVMDFINGDIILRWAQVTLGL